MGKEKKKIKEMRVVGFVGGRDGYDCCFREIASMRICHYYCCCSCKDEDNKGRSNNKCTSINCCNAYIKIYCVS
eukprot:UN10841